MLEIIGVPIDSVGRAGGTEHSRRGCCASSVSSRGWHVPTDVVDAGDLDVRLRGEQRDADTGVVAWPDVAAMTDTVMAATASSVAAGQHPGAGRGVLLARAGCDRRSWPGSRVGGLVHVDGHLDVYTGETSPTGEAADMPNAVLLGLGPQAWASKLGDAPMLRGDEVVVLGHRDPDELTDGSLDLALAQGMHTVPVERVTPDPFAAGAAGAETLDGPAWVHLDVDVLDEVAFPATDYLLPGGLTVDQLHAMLRGVFSSGHVVGFSLGCYNPEKDPARASGRQLVEVLTDVLAD